MSRKKNTTNEETLAKEPTEKVAEQENNTIVINLQKYDELIPFAWRFPLLVGGQKNVSKVFRNLTDAEALRASIVPLRNED